jgi:pimeloyl-ACP methyl ester carboxylesterase
MARDVLELLDYLQWTKDRSINVVGISMGGMISLELAKIIPERLCSMTLISTTSGRGNGEKSFSVSLPPVSRILRRKG